MTPLRVDQQIIEALRIPEVEKSNRKEAKGQTDDSDERFEGEVQRSEARELHGDESIPIPRLVRPAILFHAFTDRRIERKRFRCSQSSSLCSVCESCLLV